MKKGIISFVFIFCPILLFSYSGPFYVSSSGNDANNGSFTNPFRTIQKAVDRVSPGTNITSATTYIFPGTYNEQIVIASNKNPGYMVFTKASNSSPVLDGSLASNCAIMITNAPNIILYGLTIVNYTNAIIVKAYSVNLIIKSNIILNNKNGICIDSDSADNNYILNNYIAGNNQGIGIRIIDGDNNRIESNNIYNNLYGIYFPNINNSSIGDYILKNSIYSNSTAGIYTTSDNVDNLYISRNDIWNNGKGIAYGYGDNSFILSNYIHNNTQQGIYFQYTAYSNFIVRNIVYSNNSSGIQFTGPAPYPDNNYILTNNIWGNQVSGIYIIGADKNTISSNNIYNNQLYGVIVANAKSNIIIKNSIYSNGEDGLRIVGTATNNYILENNFNANQVNINLYINSKYNIIFDNEIKNGSQSGIKIDRSYYNIIKNNNVISNNNGISITNGNSIFTNNVICNNNNTGIRVISSSNNIFYSNLIYNNSTNGIYFFHSESNLIEKSSLYNNKNGIFITSTTNYSIWNYMLRCEIYSNTTGVYIAGNNSDNNTINSNNIYNNRENGVLITLGDQATIIGNRVTGNSNGLWLGDFGKVVQYNIINNNNYVGLRFNYGGDAPNIRLNRIISNQIGIKYDGTETNSLSKNNIYNNTTLNLETLNSGTLIATNNWWGSTIFSSIKSNIYGVDSTNLIPYRLFGPFNIEQGADTDPLPRISIFTAEVLGTNVTLIWNRATNSDFVSYNIYRISNPGETNLTRGDIIQIITDSNITNFVDNPGFGLWYYHITILDDPQPPAGSVYTNECWYSKQSIANLTPDFITLIKLKDFPSKSISPDSTNTVLSFRLLEQYKENISVITLQNLGSMSNNRDIKALKLWYDVDSSTNYSILDELAAIGIWTNNSWVFSGSIIPNTNFIITLETSSAPKTNTTFQAFIDIGDIIANNGTTNTNSILNNGIITNPATHRVTLTITSNYSYEITKSATNQPVMAMKYQDSFEHSLERIGISNLGNMSNKRDISALKVYRDNGVIGRFDGTETLLGILGYNTNIGKWTNSFVIPNNTDILITIDIADNPEKGRTFIGSIVSTNDAWCVNNKKISEPITNMGTIRIDATPPIFSGRYDITKISASEVQLSWSSATDNAYGYNPITYRIYVSQAPDIGSFNFSIPDYTVINRTSIRIEDLPTGINYFVILAVDKNGNVSTNTNVYDWVEIKRYESTLKNMLVYPVPLYRGEVLKMERLTKEAEIKIYSITGILVYKERIEYMEEPIEIRLDEYNIASGVYIVVVSNGQEVEKRKIIYIK